MVRPKKFGYNEETASNNTFQSVDGNEDWQEVAQKALKQFDYFVDKLRDYGVKVNVVEDTDDADCPDAIFPNNWITTHRDGTIITYPMYSEKRRAERREDVVVDLEKNYGFDRRYSFEYYEEKDKFLEGTGSMILDRENKIVYASISVRTDLHVLEKFAVLMNYRKCMFYSYSNDSLIYHTKHSEKQL